MKNILLRKPGLGILAIGLLTISFFQNCGQPEMNFKGPEELSSSADDNIIVDHGDDDIVVDSDGDGVKDEVKCIDFRDSSDPNCVNNKFGLRGRLFYLLDKGSGEQKAQYLYDKNNQSIRFDGSNINSVNVIIDRGFQVETMVQLSKLAVPPTSFSQGFRLSNGETLTDLSGKTLIEAFALDLRGKMILGAGMAPGDYEVGIFSDDGSILEMDLNGDGSFESIIDNDGEHATLFGCSRAVIRLGASSSIPLRVRYFQGPRVRITLTMVMRKLSGGQAAGADSACNIITNNGSNTRGPGSSVDDSSASSINAAASRGWFVVPGDMFIVN